MLRSTSICLFTALVLMLGACSDEEAVDTTPPAIPDKDLILISTPDAEGNLRVAVQNGNGEPVVLTSFGRSSNGTSAI